MKLDELDPVVSEEFDDPEKDFVEEELHAILGGKELMEALRRHRLNHGPVLLPRSVSWVTVLLILAVFVVVAPLQSSPDLIGLRFILIVLVILG